MPYLVIIRHGQSEYNLQNRFTGQLDVPLTEYGNSLRALMMYLEKIGKKEIESMEIATGIPRMYTLTKRLRVAEVNYL